MNTFCCNIQAPGIFLAGGGGGASRDAIFNLFFILKNVILKKFRQNIADMELCCREN
jgi:hypothetical protein